MSLDDANSQQQNCRHLDERATAAMVEYPNRSIHSNRKPYRTKNLNAQQFFVLKYHFSCIVPVCDRNIVVPFER